MARIPQFTARRGLETAGVVQYPTSDPVSAAMAGAGQALTTEAERWLERDRKLEEFTTNQKFSAFVTDTNAVLDDKAVKEMPENGQGFTRGFMDGEFSKRRDGFLESVPQWLRPNVEARMQAAEAKFRSDAAYRERERGRAYQATSISKREDAAANTVLQSGAGGVALVDTLTAGINSDIDGAPDLRPDEKTALKDRIKQSLTQAAFLGQPIEERQRIVEGWGLGKGFSGSAEDRAKTLLRQFEGFKSSTYWDVNANRVGFGSDTITDASGTVRRVNAGDTVSREDAERDLQRRTRETLTQVRGAVGDEAYSRLHANQQAALASVTYNYGRLPDSVAQAARTGDGEAIAKAIEGLQGHNEGINRGRRLAEANLARSSADGRIAGTSVSDARFNLPPDVRLKLADATDLGARQAAAVTAAEQAKVYEEQFNTLQTRILDGQAGMSDVAEARKTGWLRDADHIGRLMGMIERRDKGLEDVRAFGAAMATPQFPWNPVDKNHKDMADAGFKSLGGDMKALETIADRTGVVPATAAISMRGALTSGNAQRVEAALQTAANLVANDKHPDIFAGVEGGKDLTEAGWNFRNLVYGRGMTAADAARKIMEENAPGYEWTGKAKIKPEDVDQVVRKNLSDGDIRSAFDPSFLGLARNPDLAFSPEARLRAMGDYETAFRDHFMKNGDVSRSKELALAEMKRTWGVTNVNGSKVVMKFPPERARVYAGIDNVSEHIGAQAVEAVKEANGVDVPRSKIRLHETRRTGERYVRGETPTYTLSYEDKDGVIQTIPRAFYADPQRMREATTAQRAAESRKITERAGVDQMMIEEDRAARNLQLR